MELDNHILAVVEPALMPTEIKMEALSEDKGDTVDKQTKAIGAFEPFILCNGVQVKRVNIEAFEIELSGNVPKCTVSFTDLGALKSRLNAKRWRLFYNPIKLKTPRDI